MIKDVIIHDSGVGTVMEDPVVSAAQIAFSVRLKDSSDVSENTKNAQVIAKAWRGAVHTLDPDRFQIEAPGDSRAGSENRHLGYGNGLCLRIQGVGQKCLGGILQRHREGHHLEREAQKEDFLPRFHHGRMNGTCKPLKADCEEYQYSKVRRRSGLPSPAATCAHASAAEAAGGVKVV